MAFTEVHYLESRLAHAIQYPMPEVTLRTREMGSETNEGIQQYYITKIEELQVLNALPYGAGY